jgi:hypothetical protein
MTKPEKKLVKQLTAVVTRQSLWKEARETVCHSAHVSVNCQSGTLETRRDWCSSSTLRLLIPQFVERNNKRYATTKQIQLYMFNSGPNKCGDTRWRIGEGTALQTGRSRVRFPMVEHLWNDTDRESVEHL